MNNNHDMYNKKCLKCGKGMYVETSINDDWDGVLHCSSCGAVTKRYPKEVKKNECFEISPLTPEAAFVRLNNKLMTEEEFLAWLEEYKKN
jgi:DNA-directed RNA polymerase subunit M/transcription elongation factor TFIIS